MNRGSKYVGLVFEGRWKVVDTIKVRQGRYHYKVVNIYNNEEMTLDPNEMLRASKDEHYFSGLRKYRVLVAKGLINPKRRYHEKKSDWTRTKIKINWL